MWTEQSTQRGAKYADHRETALQAAQKISIDKGKPKDVSRTIHIEMSLRQEEYISGKNVRQRKEMCPAESDFQMDAGRYQTETATHTVKPSNKQSHRQADDGQCVHLSATEPTET